MPTVAKRTIRRNAVWLDGRLDAGGWQAPVRIRDLSAFGALLEGARLPAPGDEVRLACRGVVRAARVSWAERDRCGIEFVAPLDASTFAEFVTGLRIAAPKAYRPFGAEPSVTEA